MIALSSLGGSISNLAQSFKSTEQVPDGDSSNELASNQDLSSSSYSSTTASCKSAPEDDEGSVYHDVLSGGEDEGILEESFGGTIIASLSSKDVRRNIEDSRILEARRSESCPRRLGNSKEHPLMKKKNTLNEMATIQSDTLSFTPTMAELALSTHLPIQSTAPAWPKLSSIHHHYTTARSEATATVADADADVSTLSLMDGIVQPERVACPFCDREKDLQWRLSNEREQSKDLKMSEFRYRFVLAATIVTFAVAIFSFFLGKVVSDVQSEKVMAQYMAQCNELASQRDEEEMYWKLVTAAFSAMINAAAGPAANFVFGGGVKH